MCHATCVVLKSVEMEKLDYHINLSIAITEERLHVNCIFQKKSEEGEPNRMFADMKNGVKLVIIKAYRSQIIREKAGYKIAGGDFGPQTSEH